MRQTGGTAMLIDLRRLRTFVVAAEERNFTQTARVLSFSQSAVSQQIRELEDELSVRLFERRGRTVLLTPAGERLLPLALALLRDAELTGEALAPFRGAAQGVLRIGATDTPGCYLLPAVLGRFSQVCPGVRATLWVANEAELLRAAQDGDVDLMILDAEPPSGKLFGWSRLAFLEDEMVLAVAPDHPWAKLERIGAKELRDGVYISRNPDGNLRDVLNEQLAGIGVNGNWLQARLEVRNTEGHKRAIMAGLGAGWISRIAVEEEVRHGDLVVVAVDGLDVRRPFWRFMPERETLGAEAGAPMGLAELEALLVEAGAGAAGELTSA